MKEKILEMILEKIKSLESKLGSNKFKVDKIDVIALKELYNEIIKLN